MASTSTCLRVSTALSTSLIFLSAIFAVSFFFVGKGGAQEAGLDSIYENENGTSHGSYYVGNYTAQTGPRKTGPVKARAEGHKMRFTPIYQISNSPEEEYLEQAVVPIALESLARVFSLVYPTEADALVLPRGCRRTLTWSDGRVECAELFSEAGTACGRGELPSELYGAAEVCSGRAPGDCRRTPEGAGANATDFILVVTSDGSEPECQSGNNGDLKAQGGFCATDEGTGRPVAGFVNVCPGGISTDVDQLGKQVDLVVHEVLHALVMEPSLWSDFRDVEGQPVKTATDPATGRESRFLSTPRVTAFVREHFDCPTLLGAELEDEGGDGTQWSHFEESLFHGELMTGIAVGAGRSILSNLTLSLMEDSGWYQPDYSFGGYLSFGEGAGCDFASRKCESDGAAAEAFFCDQPGETACTADELALGRCETNPLANGCSIAKGFGNYQCQDARNVSLLSSSSISFSVPPHTLTQRPQRPQLPQRPRWSDGEGSATADLRLELAVRGWRPGALEDAVQGEEGGVRNDGDDDVPRGLGRLLRVPVR